MIQPSARNFAQLFTRAAMALCLFTGAASAQDYPARPIRFVVPFPAGSGIDTVGRVVLQEISRASGANIVVDYKPGALGQIGTEFAARAAPDGYTIMVSSSATHSSGAQLAKNVPYDPLRDFTHIGRVARFDVALLVGAQQGYKTPADLIADAKRRPGKLSYGYGSGTARVVAASFARAAGIDVLAVPYKGQPPALTDLIGGQIQFVTADLAVALPLVKSGRLDAIAITSARRSTLLPDVPTLAELGIRDVELSGWVGISGPANLSRDAVSWWSAQLGRALASREVIDRLHALSFEGEPMDTDDFNRFVRTQHQVWGQRIRDAGITPE